jgi:hypothetical protein
MDVPEFEDLLGRLGEDLSTWPAPQRAEAEALLLASEPARRAFAEAKALRIALRAPATKAPAGLLDRIMQRARESDREPSKDGQPERDGQTPPHKPRN